MTGINVENLNKLVKINNLNCSSLGDSIGNLLGNLGELNECYAGKDISFIFLPLVNQETNVRKIPRIIQSYSEVLTGVKTSYQRQSDNFKDLLMHSNTQIKGRR